jgi:hypothetical protein
MKARLIARVVPIAVLVRFRCLGAEVASADCQRVRGLRERGEALALNVPEAPPWMLQPKHGVVRYARPGGELGFIVVQMDAMGAPNRWGLRVR